MVRALLLLLAFLAAGMSPARAQSVWPPEARLEVIPDPRPEDTPLLVGEMVLATLHGEYRGNVALEKLDVPNFADFSWLQLSAPVWSETRIGNQPTKLFEQRIALFPKREGDLTLGSITHRLTFAGQGQRIETDAVSPVDFHVEAPSVTRKDKVWWLPARKVTVSDVWEPQPDTLKPEEWARRTVTIEVVGLPPEALPPAPPMAAGGLFSFIDPEARSTRLSPEGPVSTVVWHYRMQPQSDAPADLDDIPIVWFDTGARVSREIILAGREITFAASALPREPGPAARFAIPVGAVAGLVLGLGLLAPTLGRRGGPRFAVARRSFAEARGSWTLWRAERRGDGATARAALVALLRGRSIDPARSAALARLDRALFAPAGGESGIALAGITRAARRELRAPLIAAGAVSIASDMR